MATFTFNYYGSTGPAWTSISTNTMVFSGSGGLDQTIAVGSYQDETHIGSDDPGTDQCGANHCNNVKYISSNQMDIGGGTVAINDTNLTDNDCTLQIHFNHGSAVVITNARFYCYNGTTETTYAPDLDVFAFERGVSATSWTNVNNASGTTGGDNTGERLDLAGSASATDHYWYVAISASPESVGQKTSFDFGCALTYS